MSLEKREVILGPQGLAVALLALLGPLVMALLAGLFWAVYSHGDGFLHVVVILLLISVLSLLPIIWWLTAAVYVLINDRRCRQRRLTGTRETDIEAPPLWPFIRTSDYLPLLKRLACTDTLLAISQHYRPSGEPWIESTREGKYPASNSVQDTISTRRASLKALRSCPDADWVLPILVSTLKKTTQGGKIFDYRIRAWHESSRGNSRSSTEPSTHEYVEEILAAVEHLCPSSLTETLALCISTTHVKHFSALCKSLARFVHPEQIPANLIEVLLERCAKGSTDENWRQPVHQVLQLVSTSVSTASQLRTMLKLSVDLELDTKDVAREFKSLQAWSAPILFELLDVKLTQKYWLQADLIRLLLHSVEPPPLLEAVTYLAKYSKPLPRTDDFSFSINKIDHATQVLCAHPAQVVPDHVVGVLWNCSVGVWTHANRFSSSDLWLRECLRNIRIRLISWLQSVDSAQIAASLRDLTVEISDVLGEFIEGKTRSGSNWPRVDIIETLGLIGGSVSFPVLCKNIMHIRQWAHHQISEQEQNESYTDLHLETTEMAMTALALGRFEWDESVEMLLDLMSDESLDAEIGRCAAMGLLSLLNGGKLSAASEERIRAKKTAMEEPNCDQFVSLMTFDQHVGSRWLRRGIGFSLDGSYVPLRQPDPPARLSTWTSGPLQRELAKALPSAVRCLELQVVQMREIQVR